MTSPTIATFEVTDRNQTAQGQSSTLVPHQAIVFMQLGYCK